MALYSQFKGEAIDSAVLPHVHSGITDYWLCKAGSQLGHLS